jgi:hypothetical protein
MKLSDLVKRGEPIVGKEIEGGYTGRIRVTDEPNDEQVRLTKIDSWMVTHGHASVRGVDTEGRTYHVPISHTVAE